VLEHGLLVFRVVVFGVLRDVAELACLLDPLGHLSALDRREMLDFLLQLLVPLWGENDFLHRPPPRPRIQKRGAHGHRRGRHCSYAVKPKTFVA
jgi:hypothetical protein